MNKYLIYVMSLMLLFLAGCKDKPKTNPAKPSADSKSKSDQANQPTTTLTQAEQNQLNEELVFSAWNGDTSQVRQLLDQGAYIEAKDHYDQTPLQFASYNGHTDTAKLLLDRGANIEAKTKDGWTPLHLASAYGHTDITELLRNKGFKNKKLVWQTDLTH